MGFHLIFVLVLFLCLPLSMMAQEKKEAEGIYTIKQGDTLWDISGKFLVDPFLWPKLWQRNPYITNPHWIYPGNPVRLSPFEEVKKEEPKKIVEEKPKEAKEVKEVKEVAEVMKTVEGVKGVHGDFDMFTPKVAIGNSFTMMIRVEILQETRLFPPL